MHGLVKRRVAFSRCGKDKAFTRLMVLDVLNLVVAVSSKGALGTGTKESVI